MNGVKTTAYGDHIINLARKNPYIARRQRALVLGEQHRCFGKNEQPGTDSSGRCAGCQELARVVKALDQLPQAEEPTR